MKVQVFLSKPKSDDITLAEMIEHWSVLTEVIPQAELQIYTYEKRISPEECISLIDPDTDAVLGVFLAKRFLCEELFKTHPKLKYIAGGAHGFEEFDVELTKRYGVTITNTVYGANTIAEFAFALLMDICHKIGVHDDYMKTHDWANDPAPQYMFGLTRQLELNGMTFGVLGLGQIGLCAARIANGFGMKVISYNRHKKEGPEYSFIEQVSFEELLERSDVLSLHTPLTSQTRYIINKETISKMKDGVILINTARGALIDEPALVDALNSGKIYAAGLDVISEEPPRSDLPILHCNNATITAHIAYLPKTCRMRAVSIAINNLKNYLDGHPTSVVNK